MADRDMSPDAHEQWSERNQTLRHSGIKLPGDDDALREDPPDYSRVGGPENERAYGRTRSDIGHYPYNPLGGPYDRDTLPSEERGGYLNPHHDDYRRLADPRPADKE